MSVYTEQDRLKDLFLVNLKDARNNIIEFLEYQNNEYNEEYLTSTHNTLIKIIESLRDLS